MEVNDNNKDLSNMINMFSMFSNLMKNSTSTNTNKTKNEKVKLEFDDYINNEPMKIVKSAIPYMDYNTQKNIGILMKVIELKKTLEVYKNPLNENKLVHNSTTDNPYWKRSMLNSIKAQCSQEKKCIIDMMIKTLDIKDIMKNYSQYKNNTNLNENTNDINPQLDNSNTNNSDLNNKLNSMLTEDQQKVLNSFSQMLNKDKS